MAANGKFVWKREETPAELYAMLERLEEEYPISDQGRGLKLSFKPVCDAETVSRVTRSRGTVLIEYTSLAAAARGIGTAFAGLDGEEKTPFEHLGIMIDLSRNMVMTVDHLKMWLRRLAISGCNELYLYCEDVYELPGEPYFGYQRGAYSADELRELDDYANDLGIELIGCIQTLGHLSQILKWSAYNAVRDTGNELLVDAPETRALIDKMLAFWSETLRSRRIHLGMDETHNLGRGRYMDLHGSVDGYDLYTKHLQMVTKLCSDHHLEPMFWSDMFFRMSNPKREYYDYTTPIPAKVKSLLPPEVSAVYWDYYHTAKQDYCAMIRRHRKDLGKEPVMASGIWTWQRLWYDHKQTIKTALPCIAACRREKVKSLFFTMWGDDGGYCNFDSALAGLVRCTDLAYGADPNDEKITADRFEAVCFADYEANVAGGDVILTLDDGTVVQPQQILWDDPLLGIVCDNLLRRDPESDLKLIDRYEELLCRVLPLREEGAAGDFGFLSALLEALIRKLEVRGALLTAYAHDDRVALYRIATVLVPGAVAAMREFDRVFREEWLRGNKVFGLETVQMRNAGVIARLEETARRISEYLDDQIDAIDELDARPAGAAPLTIGAFIYMWSASSIR